MKIALLFVLNASLTFAIPNPALATTAESEGPRQLVEQAIDYEMSGASDSRSARFLQFFAPELRAAMVKDMSGPELNVIDMDVLCQTQSDCVAMRPISITAAGNSVLAKVETKSAGGSPDWAIWTLRKVAGSWHITDIQNAQWRSFLAELQKSNRLH